jgi:YHS domain-containing protein
MSTPQRVETTRLEQRQPVFRGWRNIGRRSFLRASAAAVGAAVGIAAGHPFPPGIVAFAGEATANKEKKNAPSKSLLLARCPVTGERVSEEVSIDYMGGKLYFHSAECIGKFRANKTEYEAKANAQLVVTGQFKQVRCALCGDEFALGIRTKICGVDVRFCSAECAKKVRRASADQRAELVFGKGFDKGFATRQEMTAGSAPYAAGAAGERWECVACGYVHSGSSPPAKCPECGAKSDSFMRKS